MRIDVISVFPGLVESVAEYGVTGRAVKQGRVGFKVWNPRDYATDKHRSVDDRPYGGGPGMVMMVEPLRRAIRAARADSRDALTVYLSPQGRRMDQAMVSRLATLPHLILVAGRYEGIDERLVELEIDEELSLGDYVLSGGELAAMVVTDAVTRLLPGVLGAEESAQQDSFMTGLLDHPHYTRPDEASGLSVPPVLQSGDHAAIRRWRLKQALGRTWLRRPELLEAAGLSEDDRQLLDEFIAESRGD